MMVEMRMAASKDIHQDLSNFSRNDSQCSSMPHDGVQKCGITFNNVSELLDSGDSNTLSSL